MLLVIIKWAFYYDGSLLCRGIVRQQLACSEFGHVLFCGKSSKLPLQMVALPLFDFAVGFRSEWLLKMSNQSEPKENLRFLVMCPTHSSEFLIMSPNPNFSLDLPVLLFPRFNVLANWNASRRRRSRSSRLASGMRAHINCIRLAQRRDFSLREN